MRKLAGALALILAAPAFAQSQPTTLSADQARVDLIEHVARSIVHIKGVRPAPPRPKVPDVFQDRRSGNRSKVAPGIDPFDMPDQPPMREEGTGFVYDAARGLILTAAHVIDTSKTITVVLPDGTEIPAERVGSDRDYGLGLLRVKPLTLPVLPIAAKSPRIGETTLIVGRFLPFDSIGSTQGMVIGTAKGFEGRSWAAPALIDYVALDNLLPYGGMGGGPAVNGKGEAFGIVSAMFGSNGYGQTAVTLAVPLAELKPKIEELAAKGQLLRGTLGLSAICPEREAKLCVINDVTPGSAAQAAGLLIEDEIESVNGAPLKSFTALRRTEATLPIGSEIRLTIRRKGQAASMPFAIKTQAVPAPEGQGDH
jgi:S1-C subfamily serine protease